MTGAGRQLAYAALYGDGAQPVGVLRPLTALFPKVTGAAGMTAADLGSNRDDHYGPVTMRGARYRATLAVTCDCVRPTLTVLTASDVYARPRVRASIPLEVMHDEAHADLVASHSGEVFAFTVTPPRAAGLLRLEATSRPESFDDPVRRSIVVSAAWVVALALLAGLAAQLGKGERPSRLRTSGRRNGGSVGGG